MAKSKKNPQNDRTAEKNVMQTIKVYQKLEREVEKGLQLWYRFEWEKDVSISKVSDMFDTLDGLLFDLQDLRDAAKNR